MNVITQEGSIPIFSWCPNIEQGALDQMVALSKLPFVKHCALMPDAHLGELAPIGSVIGTDGVVLPFAVGTDCGCGMGAIKTSLHISEIDGHKDVLHHSVERSIPFGFSHNSDGRRDQIEEKYKNEIDIIFSNFNGKAKITTRKEFASQLGTLGGG
jgi:tRNA-splicing ligase RtcB